MLPTATDNGARLAAILPSGIDRVRQGAIRSFVLLVVDGLGHSNLGERSGHARTLAGMPRKRIETVAPSTTGAALTTITTGALPGEHGLVGYRIRHPRLGLRTTLNEWDGIGDVREWQRCEPLFGTVADFGARAVAIGRPAHSRGGLTSAILSGAEYRSGKTIEDRFEIAASLLRDGTPSVVYLYVDELDKAAHSHGWQSEQWTARLEQLDGALAGLLRAIPSDVGVAVTADHGIIDIAQHQQVMIDRDPALIEGVAEIGGEPRFRSLYLRRPEEAADEVERWQQELGELAWAATRDEAIAAGYFGLVAPGVAERLGDVLLIARKKVALYSERDSDRALAMVGQHGALSAEERGVPLALGGALAGSDFNAEVKRRAEELVTG